MIKFFRKIRQRLLSENKFSKYLIYATGEIVLVMIGILLALQVNNWNEKRKANITEKALVNSFIETIKSDKDLFEEHQTIIEQIDFLHRNLYLIGVEKKESTVIENPNLVRRIPQDGILSIDDFPNISGQLSNEIIKKSITEYYNEIKIYREIHLELREIVANKIRPFLGNENIYDLKQWYNPQKEMTSRSNFVSKEKLIDLSNISLFQQLLIQANLKIYSMSIFSERLIEKNRNLYETLKTELRNY